MNNSLMPTEDSLSPFSGDAFVAFFDLHAFKHLMTTGKSRKALEDFYYAGTVWLSNFQKIDHSALFFSDSAILWVPADKMIDGLSDLLVSIKLISHTVTAYNLLPTCSMAFGPFEYKGRVRVGKTEQHLFLGTAYVDAYLDNSAKDVWAGMCRIVKNRLPPWAIEWLNRPNSEFLFKDTQSGFIYYWMLEKSSQIDEFHRQKMEISDTLNNKRYEKILEQLIGTIKASEEIEIDKLLRNNKNK
jgi:hypothetical protein